MKKASSEWLTLTFIKGKTGKSFLIESNANVKSDALADKCRKIYVVMDEARTEVYYVGEANTSMKKRFARGFSSYRYFQRNGNGRGGYQGYKWIDLWEERKKLNVYVLVFPNEIIKQKKDIDKRKYIQSIEGEFVFHVRSKLGYWPKYQNEIHFQEKDLDKKYCKELFGEFMEQTLVHLCFQNDQDKRQSH